MERGDVILTPSWEFHDHGHEGDGEMIWLDGLDLPVWQFVPANFGEPYADPRFPSSPAERTVAPEVSVERDRRAARSRLAILRIRRRTRCAIRRCPLSRTIGASAERIDAGTTSPERRETTSAVYHVVEGAGTTRVGDAQLEWKRGDTFAIPAWMPYVHSADEKTYLFRFDDRPLLDAVGAYRTIGLEFPGSRSARARAASAARELGGLVLLARTIDKTKAKIQGTLGGIQSHAGSCPAISSKSSPSRRRAYTQAVRELRDDEKIVRMGAHPRATRPVMRRSTRS